MNLREISNKKFFDKGSLSKCYLLEDGNILKIFNKTKGLGEMDNFKYFLKYSNDSIVFPFEFIYDAKKFYGYIMKRMPGKKLREVFNTSILTDLSKYSYKLEKDIDFVSSVGITLYDLHDGNILYDGSKYTIIDPDEYSVTADPLKAKEFNHRFHRILIGNLFLENIQNIEHIKLIRENIAKYKYTDVRPSEMIAQIKDDLEKYYKENIETIEDVNNIIRR